MSGEDMRMEKAFALEQLGHAVRRSDRELARQCWEESLDLYRALEDPWATAGVLSALGTLHLDHGKHAQGEWLLQESLVLRRSLGDQTGIADALIALTYAANLPGHYDEGERLAREAVAILQDLEDRVRLGDALRMLAVQATFSGRFAEAHRLWERVVTLREELGMRIELAVDKEILAWTKMHLGRYEEARALEEEVLAVCQETGNIRLPGWCLLALGEIALSEGSYDEARDLLLDSAASLRKFERNEYPYALAYLAIAEWRLERPAQAVQYLRAALQIAADRRELRACLYPLPAMALLLADQGEIERAVELYALVTRYPHMGNSQSWEDVVGKHIAALAATLPPDVAAAAQERGRARDLEATIVELLVELEAAPGGG